MVGNRSLKKEGVELGDRGGVEYAEDGVESERLVNGIERSGNAEGGVKKFEGGAGKPEGGVEKFEDGTGKLKLEDAKAENVEVLVTVVVVHELGVVILYLGKDNG